MQEKRAKGRLKVYGVNVYGTARRVVAATSWDMASKLIGVSLHHAQEYGSITGNDEEVDLAMSQPGAVFQTSHEYAKDKKWVKIYG